MGSFWAKYILFELKKYRRAIFHETEHGYKIWRGIDLSFQNWDKEFDKFWLEHSNVSKMFTLMGSFWANYILFEPEKVQRSYLSWNWRAIQNLKRNWFAVSKLILRIWQILTWALKSLKKFYFNELLLWKLYIACAEKVQRSYLSWNWRGIQNLERNWHFVSKLA